MWAQPPRLRTPSETPAAISTSAADATSSHPARSTSPGAAWGPWPTAVGSAAPSPASAELAIGIGCIVERLYENFNRCDVNGTANCFTHDVVYEDLLLGSSTLVESRGDFREVIQGHPVFMARRTCELLRIRPSEVAVKVDAISEDPVKNSVGVEWHVEVDGQPLPLGRGLSFMQICPRTGLIKRAVDIAEAPWRAVGLLIAPFARSFRAFSRLFVGYMLPPIYRVVVSGGAVVIGAFLVFLDRDSMTALRDEVDILDDFRDELDTVPASDLFEALRGLSGVYPWDQFTPK